MKIEKKCQLCGENKRKRRCFLEQDELICVSCCLNKQSYSCNGCSYYKDLQLKFKCARCGKTSIDDLPSAITKYMGAKVYKLKSLEGNSLIKYAVEGEAFTTTIEFPFEGKFGSPIWFYYDPEDNFETLQLIYGEIVEVKNFDEYKANVKIFVRNTNECENIENVFPELEMPKSFNDLTSLFPVGLPKIESFGKYVLVSSMIQDGGNRIVIAVDEIQPRIILYAEGFFNHWQEYAGNIKIEKSFLQIIKNYVGKKS